jgi:20S proteasome alpha/beta subunit
MARLLVHAAFVLDYFCHVMHYRNCAPAGSYFVLSLCDRLWHPDMTEAEALELMEKVRG